MVGRSHTTFILFLLCSPLFSLSLRAQVDLNKDGSQELILVSSNEEGQLNWFGFNSELSKQLELGTFGERGNQVHIGNWLNSADLSRVLVSEEPFGGLTLRSELSAFDPFPLGFYSAETEVILGRDIDSSQIADVVTVTKFKRRWDWRVSIDPLSREFKKRRVRFGSIRGVPFVFRRRGKSDSLAVMIVRGEKRPARIIHVSIRGRQKRITRIKGATPELTRPIVYRRGTQDKIAYFSQNSLQEIGRRGRSQEITQFDPDRARIVVGRFSNELEESIGILDGQELVILGEEKKVTIPEGLELIDQVSIERLDLVETAPTQTATSQPTVTVSATATSTPLLTATDTPLFTLTALPTATPQPTFTNFPTATPQPTFTSFPTFTPPPTSTSTETPLPPTVTPTITGTLPIVSEVRSDCQAHFTAGETTDGNYLIDPDGLSSGLPPFLASCDMTIDGGGWTLILNYLHQGGTNPALDGRSSNLPIINSTTLGDDESATIHWGHGDNDLIALLDPQELRFYCKSSSNSGRILHFSTTDSNCLTYFSTGFGNCLGAISSFNAYSGLGADLNHTANLPAAATGGRSNEGDLAMTEFVLFLPSTYHFAVKSSSDWWACDDNGRDSDDSYHQVWMK